MRRTFDNCERDQSFWNNFLNAFRPVSSKELDYKLVKIQRNTFMTVMDQVLGLQIIFYQTQTKKVNANCDNDELYLINAKAMVY